MTARKKGPANAGKKGKRLSLAKQTLKDLTPRGQGPAGGIGINRLIEAERLKAAMANEPAETYQGCVCGG
jgi:hypothetical protein